MFFVLAASGQVLAADNARMALNNSEWGNTDWPHTEWSNSDWKFSGWGNTDWGNTGWDKNVHSQPGEKAGARLTKVTLGIKNPEGSCMVVVTWAESNGDAVDAVAKNCLGCIIKDLANSDSPGAEADNAARFCQ